MYIFTLIGCAAFFLYRYYVTKTLLTLICLFLPVVLFVLMAIPQDWLSRALRCLVCLAACGLALHCHATTTVNDISLSLTAMLWLAMAAYSLVLNANEYCIEEA